MAPLSDLNDEEIGKIFAEHALKVAAIPPRDCLPRPANLDAILDECTRNDGEVEVCYPFHSFYYFHSH
jgi:hypothetical protein